DRREGEVDLAGADDEGDADGEQHQGRQGRKEGRVDVGRQEDLGRRVHEEGQQHQEDEYDRQPLDPLDHRIETGCSHADAPQCWSAIRYSVSSGTVMRWGEISATMAPRSSTTRRSATSCTWARLCSI